MSDEKVTYVKKNDGEVVEVFESVGLNMVETGQAVPSTPEEYINFVSGGRQLTEPVSEVPMETPAETTEKPKPKKPAKPKVVKPKKKVQSQVRRSKSFTDIIVPTYENEDLTVACFRSIKKHTKPDTYRLIWVDNGSKNTKKVVAALKDIDHIQVLFRENAGFVGAINAGLKESDAPTVCFLNNDTIVSFRWLEKLTNILYSDKKIAIVGPLTESVGQPGIDSGQNIVQQALWRKLPDYMPKNDRPGSGLEAFNAKIEQIYSGQSCDPPGFIAFHSAVIKRSVMDKISKSDKRYKDGLDSNYAMGLWDDNDYNNAINAHGYKSVLALDTCIYHRGRSTFSVIEKEGFDTAKLLNENKAYLDSIWRKKDKPRIIMLALYPYNGQGMDGWHDHGFGMTYTAAKKAGCEVDGLDIKRLFNDSELKKSIEPYDIVCFGLKSSYYAMGMNVVKMAKENGSKVLVAGYHATAAPEQLLENPDIDWVFHGESEITFPKFLKDPYSFDREIWGEKPQNLDELPFMDREIFCHPTEDCNGWWYVDDKTKGERKRMISVMAKRGCHANCRFCQPLERNHFGKRVRTRSVESLIQELKMLKRRYNPDCVMIHDDTFLVSPAWIEEFIEAYPEIGLPFWAAGRADGVCKHPDLVKRLVKVGWELVSVGFESGSQRILDLMGKGTTVEQNLEAAKIIKASGAKIYGNYMTGLPWETKEDIQATARMVDEIEAEMPSWAFFTPYPGCAMGEECIEKGWSLLDRNNYNRCPSGQKVKGVDYDYINAVVYGGFRE